MENNENPFLKLEGWGVGDIERYMEFRNIPYTEEQLKYFLNNYSSCDECGLWFKDTDFSTFCLGMVVCDNCDH